MVNIYMDVYGRNGIKELAEQNLAKAPTPQDLGAKAKVLFDGAPRFNEFVLQTTEDAYEISHRLAAGTKSSELPSPQVLSELGNAASVRHRTYIQNRH